VVVALPETGTVPMLPVNDVLRYVGTAIGDRDIVVSLL
jgi:hypothetical protein